ncbi:hypothetical protein BH24PSE2_BH24PSE2_12890 [soil metagenome]
MLTASFENSPEFDVYGEMSKAFDNSVLKSLDMASKLIAESKRPFVAFKPLTDSHRVQKLLDTSVGSKAIWMYRRPEDRASSAVTKFGDTNLRFLRELSTVGITDRWEARGVAQETLGQLRDFDFDRMDPKSAAAVFWYLRNQLFFDQRLDSNPDVLIVKYELLVKHPARVMEVVCDFLGCQFFERMVKHIHERSIGKASSKLSPEVSRLCGGMINRLDSAMTSQWGMLNAERGLFSEGFANA